MYIADTTNNYIRIITVSSGIIKSIAGSSTSGDYGGDGGAATSAKLKTPVGVAVDSTGIEFLHLFIATKTKLHLVLLL